MSNTNEQTESLLREGLVKPPDDFHNRVMQQVSEYERARDADSKANQIDATEQSHDTGLVTGVTWWQWLILLPGSAIGVTQMVRFVFSMWFVTAAG